MLTKAETLLELSFSVAWKCSVEKGVLKAIAKFIGRHLLPSLFFNKVACCTLFEKFQIRSVFWSVFPVYLDTFHAVVGNLIIKRLWHNCFPMNFSIVLKTPALKNICAQLLVVFYLTALTQI